MRLDLALVAQGKARSRSHARQLVDAGKVRIPGMGVVKASTQVGEDHQILVEQDHYVSRGAHKLLGALEDSGVRVPSRVLDAGASTGGFTQVLLERGAEVVYAVDVGHDQLAPILRGDPRVRVIEGLNLRDLRLAHMDSKPVEMVVGDVSFISLTLLLEPLLSVLAPDGLALLLVKPQFEVGRGGVDSHGVVRDHARHLEAIDMVVDKAQSLGWVERWRRESLLVGEHGNRETFCLFAQT